MLPQFGFIVAQAGADSLHPPNTINTMSQPSSQATQSTKSYPIAATTTTTTTTSNEQAPYYYTRHPSPPTCSTPMLPPPLPYMYNSIPPPPMAREEYYTNKYYQPTAPSTSVPPQTSYDQQQQHYRPLQPLPPPTNNGWHPDGGYAITDPYNNHVWHQPPPYHQPPPPPIQHHQTPIHIGTTSNSTANITTTPNTVNGSVAQQNDDYVYDQPHYSTNRWQEEPIELNENKMLRRIREFNDLMTWMDSEFWEQCDEIYREKLQSLQDEIRTIQQGTHSAFTDSLSDIELRREQTIEYAEYFKDYELSLANHQYDQDKSILKDEYENERHNLHDMVLQSIEDRRKQIKEDKDDSEFDIQDLFRDAYSRVNNKRSLRKRATFDRHTSASPSRQERRRTNRQATPYNINSTPLAAEEEELESEYINMKGGLPPRRPGATTQTRR